MKQNQKTNNEVENKNIPQTPVQEQLPSVEPTPENPIDPIEDNQATLNEGNGNDVAKTEETPTTDAEVKPEIPTVEEFASDLKETIQESPSEELLSNVPIKDESEVNGGENFPTGEITQPSKDEEENKDTEDKDNGTLPILEVQEQSFEKEVANIILELEDGKTVSLLDYYTEAEDINKIATLVIAKMKAMYVEVEFLNGSILRTK